MADTTTPPKPFDLQLFLNAVPGLFLLLDTDLIIRHVSNPYLETTYTRRADLVGQSAPAVFPQAPEVPSEKNIHNLRNMLLAVMGTKTARTVAVQRYAISNPGGGTEERFWELVLTPVQADDGQVTGIILQATGLNRREQEKSNERRSQELLLALHQNLNDLVWEWDLVTNNIWWSCNFINTSFGYPDPEMERAASCWYSRIHPDDAARVLAGIHQVIDSDLTLWSDVYRFQKKNGEYAEVLDRGSVFRDPKGKGYRMIGTMVDITLYKKPEAEWASEDLVLLP